MARKNQPKNCQLCDQSRDLQFHHLIPRKLHRRSGFRKRYDKETLNRGVFLCRICHRGLHKIYDEMTLAKQFDNIQKLKTDLQVQKHIAWSAKQKLS